jgi:N-acetyltransferase
VVLEGQYVRLEPLRLEHAEEMWPVAQEEGLFDHLSPGAGASLVNLRGWIFRRLAEESVDKAQPFLTRTPDGTAVGSTSYMNIDVRNKRVEIGDTWIGSEARRTAANTEAKLLMLQHAFEDWKAIRVQFKADSRNERAQAALKRIGAIKEGVMRNERILADGFVRDAVVYSIVDSEWPEVKKRLNKLLWDR